MHQTSEQETQEPRTKGQELRANSLRPAAGAYSDQPL